MFIFVVVISITFVCIWVAGVIGNLIDIYYMPYRGDVTPRELIVEGVFWPFFAVKRLIKLFVKNEW